MDFDSNHNSIGNFTPIQLKNFWSWKEGPEASKISAAALILSSGGYSKMSSSYLSEGLLYIGIAIALLILWILLVYDI